MHISHSMKFRIVAAFLTIQNDPQSLFALRTWCRQLNYLYNMFASEKCREKSVVSSAKQLYLLSSARHIVTACTTFCST